MKAIHLAAAAVAISALAATATLAAPCQPITNFGSNGTVLGNSLTCASGGGGTATITGPGGGFQVLDEGDGFAGQFTTGDPLLFDNSTAGSMTVDFSSSMTDVNNVAIEANIYGPYTATVTAFLDGTQVGTDSYTSVSGNTPGTIPSFNLDVPGGFNELVLSTTDDGEGYVFGFTTSSVPEPAAWAMMLVGLAGIGGMARARRGLATTSV